MLGRKIKMRGTFSADYRENKSHPLINELSKNVKSMSNILTNRVDSNATVEIQENGREEGRGEEGRKREHEYLLNSKCPQHSKTIHAARKLN